MSATSCTPPLNGLPRPCEASGLRGRLIAQFGRPQGMLGRWIGRLMALKNRRRGAWVVEQLAIQPTDRVLEIGCGPGVDLVRAGALAREGFVAGVDHSEEMARQAARRNGRGEVRVGQAERLPYADGSFERVFSINSVQFWSEPSQAFAEIHRVLAPGGRAAIAYQPRTGEQTAEAAKSAAEAISAVLRDTGFTNVQTRTLATTPAPTVCVLATKEYLP